MGNCLLTSQKEIRKAFARDWPQLYAAGQDGWLIKGDFDHFKQTNAQYGALIADYLLDWTLEVIEAQLGRFQHRQPADALLSMSGDDILIYLPLAAQPKPQVAALLRQVRAAIDASFRQRYQVGWLRLTPAFFSGVAPAALERVHHELEQFDAVLDFAPHPQGFRLLLPLGPGGALRPALARVTAELERGLGRLLPTENGCTANFLPAAAGLDTPFSPATALDPPTVSFAACPARAAIRPQTGRADCLTVYETLSSACQAALKTCKQQQAGVLLVDAESIASTAAAGQPAEPVEIAHTSYLRWVSERCLREKVYFQPIEHAQLFQFNPVYLPDPGLQPTGPANGRSQPAAVASDFRGNAWGIGLKGINDLYGQTTADQVITRLMSAFAMSMHAALVAKGIPPERAWLAQFADRITVFSAQPLFTAEELEQLAGSAADQFNALSGALKISQVRASVVRGQPGWLGCHLFQQLDQNGLRQHRVPTGMVIE
jgi:GGDEF domain-containing protein